MIHVVDEWQRHLIHIGALVRQEAAILATLCDRTTWIHDATNSSAPGWQGVLTTVLSIKKQWREPAAG